MATARATQLGSIVITCAACETRFAPQPAPLEFVHRDGKQQLGTWWRMACRIAKGTRPDSPYRGRTALLRTRRGGPWRNSPPLNRLAGAALLPACPRPETARE